MRRNRANYKSTKNTRYATNGTGAIVAKTDRDDKEDIADSALWWEDDVATDFTTVNDLKVPTVEAVADYVASGGTNNRGSWNTTDALPNTGSGTSGAWVEGNKWKVPAGGWSYLGNFFPQWTFIEAMVTGGTTFDELKIY